MRRYHKKALKHHGEECMKCGMANEEYKSVNGQDLDVHHINGDTSNHDVENLAVLCRDCHENVHYGKEGYEDLHSELPDSKQWDGERRDNWKTLRVPLEDYMEAKQQKERYDRTWGEQLVCDNPTTTEVVDVGSIVEEFEQQYDSGGDLHADEFAQEVARRIDYTEIARKVSKDVAEELR